MNHWKEKVFRTIIYGMSMVTIVILIAIIISIFREGLPAFRENGLPEMLFSTHWRPADFPPEYGMLSLLVSTLLVTFMALVIALPLGLGSAIFISEIAGHTTREILKPVIELLAGIPSVIYGLFGMAFLAPLIRQLFHLDTGLNAFSAAVILGLMVVPIISSMSEDALSNVPKNLREAALALGATQWEMIVRVVIPAARTGIYSGLIMGFGRAIGETMVVLMIAGGATSFPHSVFAPVRPLTSAIAAEMGETAVGSPHYHALFAVAVVLFLLTFTINVIADRVQHRRGNV